MDIIVDFLKDNLFGSLGSLIGIITGSKGLMSILILVALKLISNKRLYSWGDRFGTLCSAGMSKFPWWEKFESWLINGFDVLWQGVMHGLRSDNSKENDRNRDTEFAKEKK